MTESGSSELGGSIRSLPFDSFIINGKEVTDYANSIGWYTRYYLCDFIATCAEFLLYPLMYVGNDPGFTDSIGLMEIELPPLPVTSVDSAVLLSVIVKTGPDPSPIVVNRVAEPFDAAA